MRVICSPSLDLQDLNRDTQKKSKRKGRNKQEVMTVCQTDPEPEAVKTPIDLMRVSIHQPKQSCTHHLFYDGNSLGFTTVISFNCCSTLVIPPILFLSCFIT